MGNAKGQGRLPGADEQRGEHLVGAVTPCLLTHQESRFGPVLVLI